MYKNKGETPLQALNRLKNARPDLASVPLSYAGRLDPMAEGVMLVLVGEENKDREKYLGLDKTYVTEILFGVGTDTGDALGKVIKLSSLKVIKEGLERELKKMLGKFEQKYPAYSSKSFKGEYKDVRQATSFVNTDDRPTPLLAEFRGEVIKHEVEIYSAELIDMSEISAEHLLAKIKTDILKVIGDFRQAEIVELWERELSPKFNLGLGFSVAKIRLSVSSGFYVRQFAEDLGQTLGVPPLALSILREKVWAKPFGSPEHSVGQNVLGNFEIKDCIL